MKTKDKISNTMPAVTFLFVGITFLGTVFTDDLHFGHTLKCHPYCHNPNENTTQHNLNTVVGLDMKMTVQPPISLVNQNCGHICCCQNGHFWQLFKIDHVGQLCFGHNMVTNIFNMGIILKKSKFVNSQ